MTTFIFGFFVAVKTIIMWVNNHLDHYSKLMSNLVIVGVSCVLLVFITCQFAKHVLRWIQLMCHKYACKEKCRGYCLLIVGEWGSGKTTLYEDVFKDKKHIKDIKISCFSSNKVELINQLGQYNFFWKIFSLNGILSKLLENNWRTFMPKRRVVVFDDLERLHSGKNNYVDLIGIIDYLKVENKCDIILLANLSNIKNNILNIYMERIVDDICTPPVITEITNVHKFYGNSSELEAYETLGDGVYQTNDRRYYQIINNKKYKLNKQGNDELNFDCEEHEKLNKWFDNYLYPNILMDRDKHKKYSIAYCTQVLERFKEYNIDHVKLNAVTENCYYELMKKNDFSKFENIRVIKSVMYRLNYDIEKLESCNNITTNDNIGRKILVSIIMDVVYNYVVARILFYTNYNLFVKALKYPYVQEDVINNSNEYRKDLEKELEKKSLKLDYFYGYKGIHSFFESKLTEVAVKGEYEKRAFGSLNLLNAEKQWKSVPNSEIDEVKDYILSKTSNLLCYLKHMYCIQSIDIYYYMMLAIVAKKYKKNEIVDEIIKKISLDINGHHTSVQNFYDKYVEKKSGLNDDDRLNTSLNTFTLWFPDEDIDMIMKDGAQHLYSKLGHVVYFVYQGSDDDFCNKKIIDNPEFVRSAEGIYYVERSGNYFQIINGTPNRLSLKVDSETLPQYDNYWHIADSECDKIFKNYKSRSCQLS